MKYEPTLESVKKHEVPAWFHDAKFGIFIHWGIYSVPAFAVTKVLNKNEVVEKEGWRKIYADVVSGILQSVERPYPVLQVPRKIFKVANLIGWRECNFNGDLAVVVQVQQVIDTGSLCRTDPVGMFRVSDGFNHLRR